jgi:hypothetical protein
MFHSMHIPLISAIEVILVNVDIIPGETEAERRCHCALIEVFLSGIQLLRSFKQDWNKLEQTLCDRSGRS